MRGIVFVALMIPGAAFAQGDLWMGGVPVIAPSFMNMYVVYAEWAVFAGFLLSAF